MALGSVLVKLAPQLLDLIDNIIPTEQGRNEAKLKLMELEQKGQLAQIEVNSKNTGDESLFVRGWRPFIGWVCGAAFGWVFFLQPIVGYIMNAVGLGPVVLPYFDMDAMMYVLFGILGLGGLRTYEKKAGVASDGPAAPTRDTLGEALQTAINSDPVPTPVVDRKAKR